MYEIKVGTLSKEELLDFIKSWKRRIDNDNGQYPTAIISDLQASMAYVLEKEGVLDNEQNN